MFSIASIGAPAVILPTNGRLTRINDKAFYGCYYLQNITIPSSVTSIGDDAFYACYSFTEIVIPNSVTSIGTRSFAYDWNLTKLTLPFVGNSDSHTR